jgi:iron(III) transport system permease protein
LGETTRVPKKQRYRFRFDGFIVLKWAVFLFFIVFLVVPLLSIVVVSLTGRPINILGSFLFPDVLRTTIENFSETSLGGFKEFFATPRYRKALSNSLEVSAIVTIASAFICIPMAYGFAKTTMRFKKTLGALITIPLVMPTFIFSNGTILMFGSTGWATFLWRSLTGQDQLLNPHSMTAVVLVQIFSFFPYAFWPMVAAFKIVDGSLEEAAQSMGARTVYRFFSVVLPLAIAGIASGMLLVFTVSFSDFGTPIVLAPKNLNLIVVQAYREMTGFSNWSGSAVLTIVMVVVAGLFFVLQRWVASRGVTGTLSGKPTAPRLTDDRLSNGVLCGYSFLIVLLPTLVLATLILSSIATTWGHSVLPSGYTLAKYRSVFMNSSENIFNTLFLALGTLVLCVILATFVSYFVVRRGSPALDYMSSIPLVIPGVGLGIAFIQTFNTPPVLLTGTAAILVLAYTIRRLPYMVRSTMATMSSIKADLEEAAESMGASRLYTMVTVVAPLLTPGIAAGAILVFVTVVKETSITVLLARSDWAPMSLAVFNDIIKGEYHRASALAVVMIVMVVVLQAAARKLSKSESGSGF